MVNEMATDDKKFNIKGKIVSLTQTKEGTGAKGAWTMHKMVMNEPTGETKNVNVFGSLKGFENLKEGMFIDAFVAESEQYKTLQLLFYKEVEPEVPANPMITIDKFIEKYLVKYVQDQRSFEHFIGIYVQVAQKHGIELPKPMKNVTELKEQYDKL